MTTISSVGGSTSSGYGSLTTRTERRQPPDPNQIASDLFSKLDSSGDGSLDSSELQSMLDKLSSGSGTSSTGSTSASDLLKKLDADSNGSVSTDEFKQALEANRPPPPPGGMPPMPTAAFAKLGSSGDDDSSSEDDDSSTTTTTASSGFNRLESSILSALVNERYGSLSGSSGASAANREQQQGTLSLLA